MGDVKKISAALLTFVGALVAGDSVAAASDPFDSPLGDKLDLCEYQIAHAFRYDFDHVEIPAAEQALAAFHRSCQAEIAALRALLPDWSVRNGDNESIADRVDQSALTDFFNAQSDIEGQNHRRPLEPGEKMLGDYGRSSVFAHPSPLSPDETANIYRHDALGWIPDYSFHGHIGEWTYRYEPHPSSGWPPQRWWAFMDRGEIEIVINCDSLGSPERACLLDFIRHTPRERGFLSLRAGGTPFTIHAVCDPGGTGLLLDAPKPDDIEARHASLILDDQDPIALPDGDGCVAADGSLAKRILAAHHFASRYAPPFRERVIDVDGPNDALAPALLLARQVYEATRAEAGGPRFLSEMTELSKRAEPFTLEDALQASEDWNRARRCLISHGLNEGACQAELHDLDWRAAMIGAPVNEEPDDVPLSLQGARERIERARMAVAASAKNWAQSAGPFAQLSFGDHEQVATVMGHQGFVGIKSEMPYGYFLAANVAGGAIAAQYGRRDAASHGRGTIVIGCRAAVGQNCSVAIPFEAGSGGLRIKTSGGRAGANVCVDSTMRRWKGWILAKEYSTHGWRLGADHCIGEKSGAVLTHFLNHSGVRLRAPGESKEMDTRRVAPGNFDLILALTSYLSERVNHSNNEPVRVGRPRL